MVMRNKGKMRRKIKLIDRKTYMCVCVCTDWWIDRYRQIERYIHRYVNRQTDILTD